MKMTYNKSESENDVKQTDKKDENYKLPIGWGTNSNAVHDDDKDENIDRTKSVKIGIAIGIFMIAIMIIGTILDFM